MQNCVVFCIGIADNVQLSIEFSVGIVQILHFRFNPVIKLLPIAEYEVPLHISAQARIYCKTTYVLAEFLNGAKTQLPMETFLLLEKKF